MLNRGYLCSMCSTHRKERSLLAEAVSDYRRKVLAPNAAEAERKRKADAYIARIRAGQA